MLTYKRIKELQEQENRPPDYEVEVTDPIYKNQELKNESKRKKEAGKTTKNIKKSI